MDLGLTGKRALITGSHRGTGAATARLFADEGAQVYVHGLEPGQSEPVAESINRAGGVAIPVTADLTADDEVDALASAIGSDIDIVVCNYGTAARGRWGTTTSADWFESYDRNVVSAVRVIDAFRPVLVDRGWGRIVLLGTVGTVRPAEIRPQYYSAKSALPGLVVSLATSLAGTGVTANLVSPGLIGTEEVLAALDGRDPAEVFGASLAPLTPTMTTPEEVASLVAYVCSEQAATITGANLRIDSGSARASTP